MSLTCSQSLNSSPLVAKVQIVSKPFKTARHLGPACHLPAGLPLSACPLPPRVPGHSWSLC